MRIVNQFFSANVEIPQKCVPCPLLAVDSIRGFTCHEDSDVWGSFPRSLDWGWWDPSMPYLDLPDRQFTRRFINAVVASDETAAVREFRIDNPDVSFSEVRDLYTRLVKALCSTPTTVAEPSGAKD
jgi:hypothetical protein